MTLGLILRELLIRPNITIISGIRGSGKTATLFRILERAHSVNGREAFFIHSLNSEYDGQLRRLLPSWLDITHCGYSQELPMGSYVGYDEAWFLRNAKIRKDADAQLNMSEEVAMVRQRGQRVYVVIQNLGMLDKDMFKAGVNRVHKYESVDSVRTERSEFQRELLQLERAFRRRFAVDSSVQKWVYVKPMVCEGKFFLVRLPSFWCDDLSVLWCGRLQGGG